MQTDPAFPPVPPEEAANATSPAPTPEQRALAAAATKVSGEEAVAVLQTLALREQPRTNSWRAVLTLLGLSLAAFVGTSRFRWKWETIGLIVGVLFFHEMGHYLAMRFFGYRNLRMFFIPFFGAAVSGLNTRAAGWQKALVILAGPLPGIFLGAGLLLAFAHRGGGYHLVVSVALMLLVINALNLLPLLPLDGGRFLYETIFSRHPVLRAGFTALAALLLFVLAFWQKSFLYGMLGVIVLMSARRILGADRAFRRLRNEGVALTEPSPDPGAEDPVRPEALPALLDALKDGRDKPPRVVLVSEALAAIDQARARPPGFAATCALLSLYAATCALLWYVGAPFYHSYQARRIHQPPPPAEVAGPVEDSAPEE